MLCFCPPPPPPPPLLVCDVSHTPTPTLLICAVPPSPPQPQHCLFVLCFCRHPHPNTTCLCCVFAPTPTPTLLVCAVFLPHPPPTPNRSTTCLCCVFAPPPPTPPTPTLLPTLSLHKKHNHFIVSQENDYICQSHLWIILVIFILSSFQLCFSPFLFCYFQSLILLSYLIKNGSERVVTSAREHIYDLRGLESYTFTDENGKDQGLNGQYKTFSCMHAISVFKNLFCVLQWDR